MKIRSGFVSNSSSTSFIVALPKGIEDHVDLRKHLFGENSENFIFIDKYYFESASADAISEKMFADMKYLDISELFSDWYDDISRELKEEFINKAKEKYADNYEIYWATFEDHGDGTAATMLHDGVAFRYKEIPHLSIGHH